MKTKKLLNDFDLKSVLTYLSKVSQDAFFVWLTHSNDGKWTNKFQAIYYVLWLISEGFYLDEFPVFFSLSNT